MSNRTLVLNKSEYLTANECGNLPNFGKRIITFLEMKPFIVSSFYASGQSLERTQARLRASKGGPITGEIRDLLIRLCEQTIKAREETGFVSTSKKSEAILKRLKAPGFVSQEECSYMIEEYKIRREEDAERYTFLQLNELECKLYSTENPFDLNISEEHGDIHFEALECSKCFALERYTASVFHAMRLLELLYWKLGLHFKIKSIVRDRKKKIYVPINEANWGDIGAAIRKKIEKLSRPKKQTTRRKAILSSYAEIEHQMKYIKEAVRDMNQLAKFIVDASTGQIEIPPTSEGKNAAAVALGRLGGLVGGKARAKALSKKRRHEIAKNAVETRWKNAKKNAKTTQSKKSKIN